MANFPFAVDNLQVGNALAIGSATITASGANVVLPAGTQIAGGGSFGATGATGVAGTPGSVGATGLVGATGVAGSPGSVGATGLVGATGVAGTPGTGLAIGGTNTQVQFNDGGSFGGNAGLTYNKTTDTLTTSVVVHGAGTAGAPSITTTGDTNTGVFFPAADTAAISTGGTERMRITSSGNVGIGTTSPSSRLHAVSVGNTTANNKSFQLIGGTELSSGSGTQYGLYVSGGGSRYMSQTAIYAIAGSGIDGDVGTYGSQYYAVHGKTAITSQAVQAASSIYGEADNGTWNYNGILAAVRGIATPGSVGFNNAYSFSPTNGGFGGHFVAHGKADSCGVYADAYLDASPGAGAVAVPLLVATNGTQLLRVNTGGSIALAGAVNTATGTGITFPATQSASSDANTLDDYEEGTFTPTFGSSNGTIVLTYASQTGTYTKIGNICKYVIYIAASGGVTAGPQDGILQIRGLPFTSKNFSGTFQDSVIIGLVESLSSYGTSTNTLSGLIVDNNTLMQFYNHTNATTGTSPSPAQITNGTKFRVSGVYTVA